MAINAGIGLFYYPVNRVIKDLDQIQIGKFLINYINEMSAINVGQTIDFEMRESKRIISISNYIDTVLCKTGIFPRLMVKLIYDICISDDKSFKTMSMMLKIMDLISIAFQIEDDLLNIEENDLSKNKGILGEDIFEGKLTMMVINANENLDKNKSERLREILFMKTKDPELLNEAIELMKSGGGIEYAVNYMNRCIKEASELCLSLPKESQDSKESIYEIIQLINFLVNRKI